MLPWPNASIFSSFFLSLSLPNHHLHPPLPPKDGDENTISTAKECPDVVKWLKSWTDYQDGQKILLTTPTVLLGYRVEVYRTEGTTQWYTAVIKSYNHTNKVRCMTRLHVLESCWSTNKFSFQLLGLPIIRIATILSKYRLVRFITLYFSVLLVLQHDVDSECVYKQLVRQQLTQAYPSREKFSDILIIIYTRFSFYVYFIDLLVVF